MLRVYLRTMRLLMIIAGGGEPASVAPPHDCGLLAELQAGRVVMIRSHGSAASLKRRHAADVEEGGEQQHRQTGPIAPGAASASVTPRVTVSDGLANLLGQVQQVANSHGVFSCNARVHSRHHVDFQFRFSGHVGFGVRVAVYHEGAVEGIRVVEVPATSPRSPLAGGGRRAPLPDPSTFSFSLPWEPPRGRSLSVRGAVARQVDAAKHDDDNPKLLLPS